MYSSLIRLRPTAPWRIGPDSGDRDRVDRVFHSDALYGAVTSAMERLGHLEEWLDATARVESAPAVRFSSCFPFLGNELYVVPPRHVWPPPASTKVRWKTARFVPLSVVETLLSGQNLNEDAWTVDAASECLLPSSAAPGSGLFRASVRSAAAMDRSGEGVFGHSTACLEFTPGSGLWFVASYENEEARDSWSQRVRGAIRLLADSGFGGERSQGWGRTEMPEFRNGELSALLFKRKEALAGETGYWMLSLFLPDAADQIDWQRGNYHLTTRSGRVESTGDTKLASRMVSEGSVLVASTGPRGSVANVAPEGFPHPVYRAGYALSLPVPLRPVNS